jgi:uncharacterized membrane protein YwzB
MNSTKFDNVTKKISLTAAWLLYILVLYLFVEIVAGYVLDIYRKNQRGATDYTILDPIAKKKY